LSTTVSTTLATQFLVIGCIAIGRRRRNKDEGNGAAAAKIVGGEGTEIWFYPPLKSEVTLKRLRKYVTSMHMHQKRLKLRGNGGWSGGRRNFVCGALLAVILKIHSTVVTINLAKSLF